MAELEAMVRGRRNHPSIVQWDIFNEASPSQKIVAASRAAILRLDPSRPVDACSGCRSQKMWWALSDVQDFVSPMQPPLPAMLFCSSGSDENALRAQHTDTVPSEALNSSKLTAFAEAHRCGCVPPKAHLWFNKLPVADACYSVTRGVDCDQASQTYLPWATAETESIKYFGLSGTGYVQVGLSDFTGILVGL